MKTFGHSVFSIDPTTQLLKKYQLYLIHVVILLYVQCKYIFCYIQLVRDQYERSLDYSTFLDILLMEIRGITISHSSYKKREKEKKEKSLILEINEIENSNEPNHSVLEEKK